MTTTSVPNLVIALANFRTGGNRPPFDNDSRTQSIARTCKETPPCGKSTRGQEPRAHEKPDRTHGEKNKI